MTRGFRICFFVLAIFCNQSYSQDIDERQQTRLSLGVSNKFNNNLRFKLTLGVRSWDLFEEYNSALIEPSIKYSIGKTNVLVGAAYRYQHKISFDEQRYELFASWKQKIFKRTILAIGIKGQMDLEQQTRKAYLVRPSIDLTYRIKSTKLYPSIGIEWFQIEKLNRWSFTKFRLMAGFEKKINKKNAVYFGYIRQWNEPTSETIQYNFIRLNYKFKI